MYYTIDKNTGMFVVNAEKFPVLPNYISKGLIKIQQDYNYHYKRGEMTNMRMVIIKRDLKFLCAANGVNIQIENIAQETIKFTYNNQELILPDPVTREVLFEKVKKYRFVEC